MIFKNIPPKKTQVTIGAVSLLALLIIAIAAGFIFLDKKRNEFKTIHSPEKAEAEAKSLVEEVSQIYFLPDELPTIATVTDKNKLSDQEFFSKAKEGDKVLIFSRSKKAILYRQGANKIINVASLPEPSPDVAVASSSSTLSSQQSSVPQILFKKESKSDSSASAGASTQ